MDLNQLYFRHQFLRMKGDQAVSPELRGQHHDDAAQVASHIAQLQRTMGAAASISWTATSVRPAANDRQGFPAVEPAVAVGAAPWWRPA